MAIIRHKDLAYLSFGQTHIGTQEIIGVPPCLLPDFPHVKVLVDPQSRAYNEYLMASWPWVYRKAASSADRRRAVNRLRGLVGHMGAGRRVPPVRVTRGPRGIVIVDGNHRAAASYVLGKPLYCVYVDFAKYMRLLACGTGRARYAMGDGGHPYQSIFVSGTEVVAGRRRDTAHRMTFVRDEDLRGKNVLDLGCNLGASSLLAAERGATVLGLEKNRAIVFAAIRIAAACRANCTYRTADLSIPGHHKADTAFCFSIDAHLGSDGRNALWRSLDVSVLYLEGHAGTTAKDYEGILRRFSDVEILGMMSDGAHTTRKSRPLWRASKPTGEPVEYASRWTDARSLSDKWDSRTAEIAKIIPPGRSVIEFGTGRMVLRGMLPPGCTYTPSDICDRGPGTIVVNLDTDGPLGVPPHDVAVLGGVLEHLDDVPALANKLRAIAPIVVVSYAVTNTDAGGWARRGSMWKNDYSDVDIRAIFAAAGFVVDATATWKSQMIYRFVVAPPPE